MTAMPQRTALSHAFGAAAAALVGISHYYSEGAHLPSGTMVALGIEVMLGSLTFTGSMVAFAKLQGWLPGVPMTYKGQNIFNMAPARGHRDGHGLGHRQARRQRRFSTSWSVWPWCSACFS
jgi:NAD/NADP transhydrogenase beta subunit